MSSWAELVLLHGGWYPLMELQDVYKLLYQGTMGSEHMLTSHAEFSHRLIQEYSSLIPDPIERLTEPVNPDHSLLRLNLRSAKSRTIQLDPLIPSFLQTAKLSARDPDKLRSVWSDLIHTPDQGMIRNFSLPDIQQFSSLLEQKGYPVVHHSDRYRLAYQPSYRIIAAEYLDKAGLIDAG